MANGFLDLYNQHNPQPSGPLDTNNIPSTSNGFQELYKPQETAQEDKYPGYNYLGKGLLEGASSFTSPEEQKALSDPYQGELAKQSITDQNKAIKNLEPATSEKPTTFHRGLEGASKGAIEGSVFGPSGVLTGVTSGFTSETTGSPFLGLLAGIGTGFLGNTIQKAFNLGSEFNTANARLGLEGASAAEANPSATLTRRSYDWLMGSPGGSGVTEAAKNARNNSAENVINDLATPGISKSQAGAQVVTGATQRLNNIANENTNIIKDLESRVPLDTRIDANPYATALNKVLGSTTPGEEAVTGPLQSNLVRNLAEGLSDTIKNTADGMISYETAKTARTLVGAKLENAIASDDGTSIGQLKTIYRGLSESMRNAYKGMDRVGFDKANFDMMRNFEEKQQVLSKIVKEGVTPERIFNMVGSEAKLGATKLIQVRNSVDDSTWNTFIGTTLQQMGRKADGSFDLTTYANRWNAMPEEVQKALFSNTPYAELPQAYQDLALVANRFKQAGVNYNYAESGNTINLAQMFNDFIKGGVAIAGSTMSGAGVAMSGNEYGPMVGAGVAGAGSLFGAYKMASSGVEFLAQNLLAKLMTSPTFVKWSAAEVPAKAFPTYLNTLNAYIVSGDPGMQSAVKAFGDFVNAKLGNKPNILQPGEKGKGYLSGGEVSPSQVLPNQQVDGFSNGGTVKMVQGGFLDQLKAQPHNLSGGGIAHSQMAQPIPFAEGGLSLIDQFTTPLRDDEQAGYNEWKNKNAPNDSGADYDLPGAFKDGLSPADNGHFSDKFKKPNHPTFSNESQYSRQHPELPSGSWLGDHFFPPAPMKDGGPINTYPDHKDSYNPQEVKPHNDFMAEGGFINMGYAEGGIANSKQSILDTIEHYESDGKNINQQVLGPNGGYNPSVGRVTGPSSASGYWQITDSTWRGIAKDAGIDINMYPTAKSAPREVQRKAAEALLDKYGTKPWAPYNAKLAAALDDKNYQNSSTGTTIQNNNEPKSIIDHILTPENENEDVNNVEEENPLKTAINDASWIEPTTKIAAKAILSQGS